MRSGSGMGTRRQSARFQTAFRLTGSVGSFKNGQPDPLRGPIEMTE